MSDLKPCPFCGEEARLTYSTDNHRKPYVTCDTPKCPGCNTYQWHYHTEAEAIEAWNRRAERTAMVWKPAKGRPVYESGICSCGSVLTVLQRDFVYCPHCGSKLEWSK